MVRSKCTINKFYGIKYVMRWFDKCTGWVYIKYKYSSCGLILI